MPYAKPKIRLYVPVPCAAGREVELPPGQAHYLTHVMRARPGDAVAVFNGEDGEWRAEIAAVRKKEITLALKEKIAPQTCVPDIWLAFAPVKARTESIVEKAVELGAAKLLAVVTQYSVVRSVNLEKLAAHAVEAAEQCGRREVPPVETCKDLRALLGGWPKDRILLHGDESGSGEKLPALLASGIGKCALLVGPEGGFSPEERALLKQMPFVRSFSMGPRILRADTAAAAALACTMAALGDWDAKPDFDGDA